MRTLAPLCLVVLLAGCSGGDPDLSATPLAITDGTAYAGHPAVGALTDGNGLCTATLVGSCTVLTAAHCVQPGARYYFVLGKSGYPASSATRHPDYGKSGGNDLAVVLLSVSPPVAPAAIATAPPAVGQELTLIGYGASDWNGSPASAPKGAGERRMAKNKVAGMSATRLAFVGTGNGTGNLCFGDSGGPSFAQIDGVEVQVGVHSTIAAACGVEGHDMRVDAYADWIEDTAGSCGVVRGDADHQAPAVTISEPADGATVPAALAVLVQATDAVGVAAVALAVDGVELARREAEPYRFFVELSPGPHALEASAVDAAGNEGRAAVTITVDAPPESPDAGASPPAEDAGELGAGAKPRAATDALLIGGCGVGEHPGDAGAPLLLLLALLAMRCRPGGRRPPAGTPSTALPTQDTMGPRRGSGRNPTE